MAFRTSQFLSLFSGCGGFDLGFINAGFSAVAGFDSDPDAVRNYRANLGNRIHTANLMNGIPEDDYLKGMDVLIAGPPCQGFSTVGKRRIDDERNSLLIQTGILTKRIQPKVAVIENVPGALAGDHARYWKALMDILRLAGYRTHNFSCQAAHVGMAQLRKRLFLIAWRTGCEIDFPQPNSPPGTLRGALKGASNQANHFPQSLRKGDDMWKIASRIGSGQKLSNVRSGPRAVHTWHIPEVFGQTTEKERTLLELLLRLRRQNRQRDFGDADPVSIERLAEAFGSPFRRLLDSLIRKGYICRKDGSFDLVHTFNGKFRRLAWDAPSCTVDTRFGDPRYFLHPDKPRGFTVREAARIQGFPDRYVFEGETKAQYRLIGNAVPPPLAESTAAIVTHLLGGRL